MNGNKKAMLWYTSTLQRKTNPKISYRNSSMEMNKVVDPEIRDIYFKTMLIQ